VALEQNRKLIQQLQRKLRDMDQIFATKKDALRRPTEVERPKRSCANTPPAVMIIVEDDSATFKLLKQALWKAGSSARVWWAQDVPEALSILAAVQSSTPLVCVVCDVCRPGLDSFALLQQVRSTDPAHFVKFVGLARVTDSELEARARQLGADGFFVWSSTPTELAETGRALEHLLRQPETVRQRQP